MSNLAAERKSFEELGLIYPVNQHVQVNRELIGDVDTYWFTPKSILSPEVIIYLHGGGFIYGSIRSHQSMVTHIADATGRKILFVDYSLAPERPFPAAQDEIVKVIRMLAMRHDNFDFGLLGDSAGGNLVMTTALRLKEAGLPVPQYQVLISPWLNVNASYKSYLENVNNDPVLTADFIRYAASCYTTSDNFSNPLVSPALGNFAGIEPTLILVGAEEILRDDSVTIHEVLTRSGVTSVLRVFDDVTHVWLLTDIESANSRRALSQIRNFMDAVMKRIDVTL